MLRAGSAGDLVEYLVAQLVNAFSGQRGGLEYFNAIGAHCMARSQITLVRDHQRSTGPAGFYQIVIVFRQSTRTVDNNKDQIGLAESFIGFTNPDTLGLVGGVADAGPFN